MSAVEMCAPAATPDAIPTPDELMARARALAPKLRERAERAERDRNIPLEIGRGIRRRRHAPHPDAKALERL